ncbi:MAG: QueT transporter family protein [Oscillospiraceae bacterium]|nr:QueT transporter family protein [Oscillospiraceae bacterium]
MRCFSTREMTAAALVGGLYVVLSYFSNIFGLTFGPVQCRFSEALTVLPFLYPASAWGLFIGCIVSNLLSPYGPLDLIFGSAATLMAGLLTARCRRRWLAALPPVLCNAVIVGAVIAFQEVGFSGMFGSVFIYHALTVGVGQVIACYGLGTLLLGMLGGRVPRKEK